MENKKKMKELEIQDALEYTSSIINTVRDPPELRELLEDILPKTTSFDNFKVEHNFPDIGKRIMLLNACRIYLESNRTKLIILTIEDITERKKIEELREKIKELEARLKKNT
jgi:two-component system CheB/CheR fusion protein